MYQARNIIRAERFGPRLSALLLNILDDTWANCETRDVVNAGVVAAALCAMARSGLHAPERLRRYAASVAANPKKFLPHQAKGVAHP